MRMSREMDKVIDQVEERVGQCGELGRWIQFCAYLDFIFRST